eukprot:gnl/TRDRNA2_/TRDRNA2_33817_c0_seq1.p1 gnl/TRDRNA2_/TRDRNA2_33817_c0~~gnl/TRDRNA2_/TRDRNA2_33817_c0_seq1.p1  ORF type:complete len:243 (-),score=90.58 gnl/TRDRNA2_/TRDRNA2_33817_c0_seq1:352-1080(-)
MTAESLTRNMLGVKNVAYVAILVTVAGFLQGCEMPEAAKKAVKDAHAHVNEKIDEAKKKIDKAMKDSKVEEKMDKAMKDADVKGKLDKAEKDIEKAMKDNDVKGKVEHAKKEVEEKLSDAKKEFDDVVKKEDKEDMNKLTEGELTQKELQDKKELDQVEKKVDEEISDAEKKEEAEKFDANLPVINGASHSSLSSMITSTGTVVAVMCTALMVLLAVVGRTCRSVQNNVSLEEAAERGEGWE